MVPPRTSSLGVLLALVLAAWLGGCGDPKAEIQSAFASYQSALAAHDGAAALRVTHPDSVEYWGRYFRDHALHRTREELEPRSAWEQSVILLYRDQLGVEFLRDATPEGVYVDLATRPLLLFRVGGVSIGAIRVDGEWAEADLIAGGVATGYTLGFRKDAGTWKVLSHSHAGYSHEDLRGVMEATGTDKRDVVRRAFRAFTGHEPADELYDAIAPR